MSRWIFLLVIVAIYLAIDIYVASVLKQLFPSKWFRVLYIVFSIIIVGGMFVLGYYFRGYTGVRLPWTNVLLAFVFAGFVLKFLLAGLFLLQDSTRVLQSIWNFGKQLVSSSHVEKGALLPGRRKAMTAVLAGVASIPFLALLYGATRGKYKFQVDQLNLSFDDLPKAFDGFKIVQISDIHSGSYDSVEQVLRGVEMINALKPDLVVFTGDLVNIEKDEIDPYIETFSRVQSTYGNYSITGNHDYIGVRRADPNLRQSYWQDFMDKHKQMGFELLMNENRQIEREGSSLRLVGVENWGRGPFPKNGDLNRALEGVASDEFTVLLSHDPTHWDDHTLKHDKKVHLTLSGHTHGMQFGIDALGIKWSPIKMRYKKWAGLYEELDQYLYVNRGFGFLGYPGRVGMWPEITEITLRAKDA